MAPLSLVSCLFPQPTPDPGLPGKTPAGSSKMASLPSLLLSFPQPTHTKNQVKFPNTQLRSHYCSFGIPLHWELSPKPSAFAFCTFPRPSTPTLPCSPTGSMTFLNSKVNMQFRRLWALAIVRLLFSLIYYLPCLPVKILLILGTEDLPILILHSAWFLSVMTSFLLVWYFFWVCMCVGMGAVFCLDFLQLFTQRLAPKRGR